MRKKILIPLPSFGFDPTEVSVPWKILTRAGHHVIFATPEGHIGKADPFMLTGKGLGIFASFLMADRNGQNAYQELCTASSFVSPLNYHDLKAEDFDALLLPGGHAPGMKIYLESSILQRLVFQFSSALKPIAAICHGVVLAARSVSPQTNRSVLWGYKTTALPRYMELGAWTLTRFYLGDYYRTYSKTVQREVSESLRDKSDFVRGPLFSSRALLRDSPTQLEYGFVVTDRNYLSARWPGDAHLFGHSFLRLLEK